MIAIIVKGSKTVFDIKLRDSQGNPISLTPYTGGGVLRFRSCVGVITTVTLDVPGSNPDAGSITVEMLSAVTALADEGWSDADLILTDATPEPTIVPLVGAFSIQDQAAPV